MMSSVLREIELIGGKVLGSKQEPRRSRGMIRPCRNTYIGSGIPLPVYVFRQVKADVQNLFSESGKSLRFN